MGRYRPPAKKGSPYITPQGMAALEHELDYLWNKRRPLVVKALSTAAAEGDRSENAESMEEPHLAYYLTDNAYIEGF